MNTEQTEFLSGETLKQQGTAAVLDHNPAWGQTAWGVLEELAASWTPFTSDDLREKCKERGVPEPHHHNAWGALIFAAACKGTIHDIGRRKSRLPAARGRMLALWQGRP